MKTLQRRFFLKKSLFYFGTCSLFTLPKISTAKTRLPQRIIETWYAHNAFLIMLGAVDKIIATVATPENCPWMFYFFPILKKAHPLKTNALNPESLAKNAPDLIILPKAESITATQLKLLSLPAFTLHFTSFSGLLQVLDQTAALLGTDYAANIARSYRQEFLTLTLENQIPLIKRPKILHIAHLSPLQIDGKGTIIDEWIHYGGGENAATITGNKQPITQEQLFLWNPDIIILAANASHDANPVQNFIKDPLFSKLKACQKKKIYTNPSGVFLWDRYGPEILLQLYWIKALLANTASIEESLLPHLFSFYRQFYKIILSEEEAYAILHGEPPPPQSRPYKPRSPKENF